MFFRDVESGMIVISLTEYTQLPAPLAQAWRAYKNEKLQCQQKTAK
jgi:hypothetical protein